MRVSSDIVARIMALMCPTPRTAYCLCELELITAQSKLTGVQSQVCVVWVLSEHSAIPVHPFVQQAHMRYGLPAGLSVVSMCEPCSQTQELQKMMREQQEMHQSGGRGPGGLAPWLSEPERSRVAARVQVSHV